MTTQLNLGIDWPLLHAQKGTLFNAIANTQLREPEFTKAADGILHLLDAMQDEAVDSGQVTEEEVFGHAEV